MKIYTRLIIITLTMRYSELCIPICDGSSPSIPTEKCNSPNDTLIHNRYSNIGMNNLKYQCPFKHSIEYGIITAQYKTISKCWNNE